MVKDWKRMAGWESLPSVTSEYCIDHNTTEVADQANRKVPRDSIMGITKNDIR